jgi:hypothetical protein
MRNNIAPSKWTIQKQVASMSAQSMTETNIESIFERFFVFSVPRGTREYCLVVSKKQKILSLVLFPYLFLTEAMPLIEPLAC